MFLNLHASGLLQSALHMGHVFSFFSHVFIQFLQNSSWPHSRGGYASSHSLLEHMQHSRLSLLRCSTCGLVFGCWELNPMIFLKLRKKELLAKMYKFTKWQLFSLKTTIWVKIVVIFVNLLSLANNHLQDWKVNTLLSFSGER